MIETEHHYLCPVIVLLVPRFEDSSVGRHIPTIVSDEVEHRVINRQTDRQTDRQAGSEREHHYLCPVIVLLVPKFEDGSVGWHIPTIIGDEVEHRDIDRQTDR